MPPVPLVLVVDGAVAHSERDEHILVEAQDESEAIRTDEGSP